MNIFRELSRYPRSGSRLAKACDMPIRCLACDYDGTLAPLGASREKSRVPLKVYRVLERIGMSIPIAVITSKDLRFVEARTPFANVWSAVNGLETKIGDSVRQKSDLETELKTLSSALEYAKSALTEGIEIEEKRDSLNRPIGFCLDWRRARNSPGADVTQIVKEYCLDLGLRVETYGRLPFFDVYPIEVDKGTALQELQKELAVQHGTLYIGDSSSDNPAFEISDLGIGVDNGENTPEHLVCDGIVDFEDTASFLNALLENHLVFNLEMLPMVRRASRKGDSVA